MSDHGNVHDEHDKTHDQAGKRVSDLSDLIPKSTPSGKFEGSNSPVRLNEEGERRATESGIVEHVRENVDRYLKETASLEEEFQIFDKCQELAIRTLRSDSGAKGIRSYFYGEGIDDNAMFRIYSLKMRDVILEERKKTDCSAQLR